VHHATGLTTGRRGAVCITRLASQLGMNTFGICIRDWCGALVLFTARVCINTSTEDVSKVHKSSTAKAFETQSTPNYCRVINLITRGSRAHQ